MDDYSSINFKLLSLHDFTFNPSTYIEYQGGRVLSSGRAQLTIDVKNTGDISNPDLAKYRVSLHNNNISGIIVSSFEFDRCMASTDRLLFFTFPRITNASCLVLSSLKAIGIPYSRLSKHYQKNEPVACSLFTENNRIKRISFTLNPERLLEFE